MDSHFGAERVASCIMFDPSACIIAHPRQWQPHRSALRGQGSLAPPPHLYTYLSLEALQIPSYLHDRHTSSQAVLPPLVAVTKSKHGKYYNMHS